MGNMAHRSSSDRAAHEPSQSTLSRPSGEHPLRLALLMEMEADWVFYTQELSDRSGVPLELCRQYLREFRDDGLAVLTPCFSEDGNWIKGRGYSLTKAGVEARIVAKNGGRA